MRMMMVVVVVMMMMVMVVVVVTTVAFVCLSVRVLWASIHPGSLTYMGTPDSASREVNAYNVICTQLDECRGNNGASQVPPSPRLVWLSPRSLHLPPAILSLWPPCVPIFVCRPLPFLPPSHPWLTPACAGWLWCGLLLLLLLRRRLCEHPGLGRGVDLRGHRARLA
jgi:hypothetical protein